MISVHFKNLEAIMALPELEEGSTTRNLIQEKAKNGGIYYDNGDESCSILADGQMGKTFSFQDLEDKYPLLFEVATFEEILGVKKYDEDGNFDGYTPRGSQFVWYDRIRPKTEPDGEGGEKELPLMPLGIAGAPTSELNLNLPVEPV